MKATNLVYNVLFATAYPNLLGKKGYVVVVVVVMFFLQLFSEKGDA